MSESPPAWRPLIRRVRSHWSGLLAVICLLSGSTAAFGSSAADLYLSVEINGAATNLIAHFRRTTGGRLMISAAELHELGLRMVKGADPAAWTELDTVEGLSYQYIAETQSMKIKVDDGLRRARIYEAMPTAPPPVPESSWGAVVNYTGYAATPILSSKHRAASGLANLSLDARVFTPVGVLEQTGIIGSSLARDGDALRLATTLTYSDPKMLRTYRVGDHISGSLPWTRSLRLGGAQVQSDFGLRSDLITTPLPIATGSAAVPSTADVYLGSTKLYSTAVDAGPFQITNLPYTGSTGDLRVLMRDSSGKLIETSTPVYDSSRLLRPGLFSFSVEAGRPRLFYGLESNSYGNEAVASASARYGLSPYLTLEAHAEGGAGLSNGGMGATLLLGRLGTLSLAASASRTAQESGSSFYAAYETRWRGYALQISSLRTLDGFQDLASVTAPRENLDYGYHGLSFLTSVRIPKALDRLTISMPAFPQQAGLSFSFFNAVDWHGVATRTAAASYSVPFAAQTYLFASAFTNVGGHRRAGIYGGLAIPLGTTGYVNAGLATERNGTPSLALDASKPLELAPGSVGWRATATGAPYGRPNDTYKAGTVSYRASSMRIDAGTEHFRDELRGTLSAEGGVALTSDGIFFANRIEDAFVVADVGAAGVPVSVDNRYSTKTDSRGKALISGLRSYERAKISVDTRQLPLEIEVPLTDKIVVPGYRSGVSVAFGAKVERAALVEFVHADGRHVTPGARGVMQNGSEFRVGYDGQAYLRSMSPMMNEIVIEEERGSCRAQFAYEALPNQALQRIVCR